MNRTMTRLIFVALAAVFVVPGVASARIIEIGQASTAPAPSCPTSPCEVISRTTAFQTRIDGKRKMFVAPATGRIVAWSITLGTPGRRQRKYFEENLGGAAQAGISVLRQGDRRYGRVTGESPVQNLTPYFGETVQFPLTTSLAINKGDVVALTVPTWAPALGIGLGRDNWWRSSRRKPPRREGCTSPEAVMERAAQGSIGGLRIYGCTYFTARILYTATYVTDPRPTS